MGAAASSAALAEEGVVRAAEAGALEAAAREPRSALTKWLITMSTLRGVGASSGTWEQ